MATFVLVPGFWIGAWAWQPVTADLRARGHDVYPLSLTGMAERVQQSGPDIDLRTHVTDVLDLIRYEELDEVVLVGHSYAGAVVTPGVADQVPERIRKLVFVDSGPLPDGMSQSDFTGPDERARNAGLVATVGDGWQLPPPPWEQLAAGAGVDAPTLERIGRLSVPQPWKTAISPSRLTGAWQPVPRLYLMNSFTQEQARAMAATMPTFQHVADPGGEFRELPGWHWPMFEQPAALAAALHEAA